MVRRKARVREMLVVLLLLELLSELMLLGVEHCTSECVEAFPSTIALARWLR